MRANSAGSNMTAMNKFSSIISILFLLASAASSAQTETTPEARVLLFGGTGKLGSDIAKTLYAIGHEVTVFARPTSNRERLAGFDIDYVIGDVLDAESVRAALNAKRFDVVIDALGRGSSGVEFFKLSAENIAGAAKAAGIQQLILHGSVGAGDSAKAFGDSGVGDRMRSLFMAKTAGEQAAMSSGVQYTIIRNSRLLRYGLEDNGNAELYEEPMLTGSVTRAALARLTATCVLNVDCYGKTYHAVDKSLSR